MDTHTMRECCFNMEIFNVHVSCIYYDSDQLIYAFKMCNRHDKTNNNNNCGTFNGQMPPYNDNAMNFVFPDGRLAVETKIPVGVLMTDGLRYLHFLNT